MSHTRINQESKSNAPDKAKTKQASPDDANELKSQAFQFGHSKHKKTDDQNAQQSEH